MSFALWLLFSGLLMTTMALSGTTLTRAPVTAAILYLVAGYALGPAAGNILTPDPLRYSVLLERIAEIAMLISLFAVGLKLGLPLRDHGWRLPARLAVISMMATVALLTLLGIRLLDLSLGAAVLLGAILAPTDPVLASDVQVAAVEDRDRLRFSLTGEGGLNDGIAFPFVMLGLGLLDLHSLGAHGWRWLVFDVLWGAVGGLAIGGLLGWAVGTLVVYLRSRHEESVGRDEFLALGLIALSYAIAVLCGAGGFLAVFGAGLQRSAGAHCRSGGGVHRCAWYFGHAAHGSLRAQESAPLETPADLKLKGARNTTTHGSAPAMRDCAPTAQAIMSPSNPRDRESSTCTAKHGDSRSGHQWASLNTHAGNYHADFNTGRRFDAGPRQPTGRCRFEFVTNQYLFDHHQIGAGRSGL